MRFLRNILKPVVFVISGAEHYFDKLKYNYRKKRGYKHPLRPIAYNGLGNQQTLIIKGRVLSGRTIDTPAETDNGWKNFKGMIKRLVSVEVPFINVEIDINGAKYETSTDQEGYFHFKIPSPASAHENRLWYEFPVRISDPSIPAYKSGETTAFAQIPSPRCTLGIISDIDDTVLQTNVTNLIRMLKVVFLHNARTRLPFEGVAAFYQALCTGEDEYMRPLFFVSSSPWNIYDLLVDFCRHRLIPQASFFLRDMGISRESFFASSHHSHKSRHLDLIFDTYPEMKFILLGDSGQHDPEIFLDAVKRHPGRIHTIYIRDVSNDKRDKSVQELIEEVLTHDCELVFVKDSFDAAQHAAKKNLIKSNQLDEILLEKIRDEEK